MHEQVTAWGMRTQLCASAEIALAVLEAAAADPFRVILVDFVMPGMDGLELARRIHASPTQDSKVFLLSSSGQSISKSLRRDVGLTGCMTKPVKSDHLRDTWSRPVAARWRRRRRLNRLGSRPHPRPWPDAGTYW
jgi:CheY-like chemotaxis protein